MAAATGATLEPGRIHVAVPGRHLLVLDHRILLSKGSGESGHRPALNALFRSVAVAFGPKAVAVLLSGVLDDGVLGLAAIRARGGVTLCQSPEDALFPTMPNNALRAGLVDRTADAADMGTVLVGLAERAVGEPANLPDRYLELENRIAMTEQLAAAVDLALGSPSGFSCPDCNGSLRTLDDGYYRCHLGHAWSAGALLAARDREVHSALLVAVRSLQEKSRLAHQLAGKAVSAVARDRYAALATETEKALDGLRERIAVSGMGDSDPDG